MAKKKKTPDLGMFAPAPDGINFEIKNHDKFSLSKQMELESIILLENKPCGSGTMLPLSPEKPIAVFGNGQLETNTGGGGSGGSMGAFRLSFMTGLRELGAKFAPELAEFYAEKLAEGGGSFKTVHGWDNSDAAIWGTPQFSNSGWNNAAPIATPELMLDGGEIVADGIIARAAELTDTAVFFISRTVGTEEMDRGIPQPSDWYLNPSEKTLLRQISARFDNIIAVINSSGSTDLSWTQSEELEPKLKALILSYGAGSYYGSALAELIYGKENFSAKLADTLTWEIDSHHTMRNSGGSQSYAQNGTKNGFGDGGRNYGALNGENDPVSIYQEYVYMGYRYFDTFCGENDPVAYPFGYGLSYSQFEFSNFALERDGDRLTFSAEIKNISETAGKEVLELYISAPNSGALDQPYQKLVAYAKTKKLMPNQSQKLTLDFTLYDISSYSEAGAQYVLEAGDYLLRAGNSSRSTHVAGVISVTENVITDTLTNRLSLDKCNPRGDGTNQAEFDALRLNSRKAPDKSIRNAERDTMEISALGENQRTNISQADVPALNPRTEKETKTGTAPEAYAATLQSVVAGETSVSDFTAQMTDEELMYFLAGGCGVGVETFYSDDSAVSLTHLKSKPSEPNSYVTGAGTSRAFPRLGIPSLSYCDGSTGVPVGHNIAENLGLDPNPAYPRAPGIGCLWNPELQRLWGKTVAKDMRAVNIDIWLAPSINLHRNPLNGRNAEYDSEDPVLSGIIAQNVACGVAEEGVTVCLKHFAGNDQEQFRRGRHTKMSEIDGTSLDAINTISSERALREITLKPFEMAVRNAPVRCVMSAFNKINGEYAAASRDLLLEILRGEWGFEGFVVTDWGDNDEVANGADELENGNDMIMSGMHVRYSIMNQILNGFGGISDYDGVHTGTDKDTHHPLSRKALERNAQNVLHTIMNSKNIYDGGKYNTGFIGSSDARYHEKTELRILTAALPAATVGTEYSLIKPTPIIAAGDEGTSRYRFSTSGNIPGITLHGNGKLTGVPTESGEFEITIRVDSDFGYAEKTLTIAVRDITITPETLPGMRLGVYYDKTISALGKGNVALSLIGSLPDGIAFEPDTGRIHGTPANSAKDKDFSFTARATDERGLSVQTEYTVHVSPEIDVTIPPCESAVFEAGEDIYIPIVPNRKEFSDMYSFDIAYGELPAGLRVGGFIWMGYSISGSAAAAGEYDFGIRVIVQHSYPEVSVVVPYKITITEPTDKALELKSKMLPAGKVHEIYSKKIALSGGSGQKTFTLLESRTSEKLPAGFALSEDGQVTCAPMASDSGVYAIGVRIEDESAYIEDEVLLHIAGALIASPETGETLHADAGKPARFVISASGGFTEEYTYALNPLSSALPSGLKLTVNSDYTAEITGTAESAGEHTIIIDIDESFSGSPVSTTVVYKLIVK